MQLRWRRLAHASISVVAAVSLVTSGGSSDPLDAALDFHRHMQVVVHHQQQQEIAREQLVVAASRGAERMPALLLIIRAEESGGNYAAFNPSGCENYGCGGAYQLHALYASVWAERAGYPHLSSQAQQWPASVQDEVALELFYSTNPDGAHWCLWVDYC